MPTVFRIDGFRFFFYSAEPGEPVHVHVTKGDGVGKWWVDPVAEEWSDGFTKREIRAINRHVSGHRGSIIELWNDHFKR